MPAGEWDGFNADAFKAKQEVELLRKKVAALTETLHAVNAFHACKGRFMHPSPVIERLESALRALKEAGE